MMIYVVYSPHFSLFSLIEPCILIKLNKIYGWVPGRIFLKLPNFSLDYMYIIMYQNLMDSTRGIVSARLNSGMIWTKRYEKNTCPSTSNTTF